MSVDFTNFPGKFTRLVLGGGGPKGMAILGALHYIDQCGGLDHIEEYWGTSIGSILCLLLLIGYSPFEAFHQFFMQQHFIDPKILDLQSIIEETALCPIAMLGHKLKHLIEKKLGPGVDPTFYDLYQSFGKRINIIGANTDTLREECFNIDTQPSMKVSEAIEISCDLPLIFTKKTFQNHTYVDGGFINIYPINLADDGLHHVLGVCVFGNTGGNDTIGWIYRLLSMSIMELHRMRVDNLSPRTTHIQLTIDNIGTLEMSPSAKKKVDAFSLGYQQARDILKEDEHNHVQRKRRLACADDPNRLPKDHGWEFDDW